MTRLLRRRATPDLSLGTRAATADDMHVRKRLAFGAMLFIVPLAAWALVKPLRVLAPQLEGLTCDEGMCVDGTSRRAGRRDFSRCFALGSGLGRGTTFGASRGLLCHARMLRQVWL